MIETYYMENNYFIFFNYTGSPSFEVTVSSPQFVDICNVPASEDSFSVRIEQLNTVMHKHI